MLNQAGGNKLSYGIMQEEKHNPIFINDRRLIIILTVVVLFLLGVNGWFFFKYMALKNSPANSALINEYPLIDPVRKFHKQDDLIVNIQPLRDEFSLMEKDTNISIYFEVLNTGANISINKDAEFFPASLLKVPMVIAAVKKIERKEWSWDTELELTEQDKSKDFGELWKQSVGTRFTVEELIKQVLINSDNTAYFILLRNLGPEEFLKIEKHLGLLDFFSKNKEISAKRYAPILRSLFSASYLTAENSEKILEWMSMSSFKNYLASGLPPTVKFSHKIGVSDEKKVFLDTGIVYLKNRPYIIIVMIKNHSASEAEKIMKDIGQEAYEYMANYPQHLYD